MWLCTQVTVNYCEMIDSVVRLGNSHPTLPLFKQRKFKSCRNLMQNANTCYNTNTSEKTLKIIKKILSSHDTYTKMLFMLKQVLQCSH